MNNEIKIALTVVLEPKRLLSTKILKFVGDQPQFIKEEVYSKGVFQNIYMSIATYNDMVKSRPFWVKDRDWKRFTKTQRIDAHMQRICEYLGGQSYTFEILS